MRVVDLAQSSLRDVNATLQAAEVGSEPWVIENPRGAHAVAVGLDAPIEVTVQGSTGYYCAGMNAQAQVRVIGSVGPGVAENMMSGAVRVSGDASQYAGATAHGGLLVIEGNASSRCGISMKGVEIVVYGDVGHMSAFMAQAGTLVVCGDAGDALGDSIYEAEIFVAGQVKSLGADCEEKPMTDAARAHLAEVLARAGKDADPASFRRYGSARTLYHFDIDNAY